MYKYADVLERALTPHPDDPLAHLRRWRLPYKTQHRAEYYTTGQIKDLQDLALDYQLEEAEEFAKIPPRELRYRLNGIVDNDRPFVRRVATKVNPEFQIAAAIHDIDFDNANGNPDKALEANARMYRNLLKISDKTSANGFTRWWNKKVHAKIYKSILDAKFHGNLQAAWESKQLRLKEKQRRLQAAADTEDAAR